MNKVENIIANENEIEGSIDLLDEQDKKILLGHDDNYYYGKIRSYDVMAHETNQIHMKYFLNDLETIFPPPDNRKRTYTNNCRLLIRQSIEKVIFYEVFVLLYKKYLLHFKFRIIFLPERKEMTNIIRSFKEEFEPLSRVNKNLDYFLKQCPQRDSIYFSYEPKSPHYIGNKTLYGGVFKVKIGEVEQTFFGQRYHFPTIAELKAKSDALTFLKSYSFT